MKLYDKTIEELVEMDRVLCADPANRNPDTDSIFLYDRKTQDKLLKIGRAIADKVYEGKKERGEYVNEEGYSGRQSKR